MRRWGDRETKTYRRSGYQDIRASGKADREMRRWGDAEK